MDRREKLLDGIDLSVSVGLEIGPLHAPTVRKSDGRVVYVDHLDTEGLRAKYAHDAYVGNAEIVPVDAVWGDNSLRDILGDLGAPFDYVIAAHVMEHVPDMITWLHEVRSVLKPTGVLRLALPDRRFTFDYLRRETELVDVLHAYLLKARKPLPIAILDEILNTTPVDNVQAWSGKISPRRKPGRYEAAMYAARMSIETVQYTDVHSWVFTCDGFKRLMADIAEVGLLPFALQAFHPTALYQIEFVASFRPCDDPVAGRASFL
jgi:SAM-dependent methyltransferase